MYVDLWLHKVSDSCRFFSILEAIETSKGKLICFPIIAIMIVGRAITIKCEIMERSKEIIPKMNERQLRVITSQGAIEKSPILLFQYWKN